MKSLFTDGTPSGRKTWDTFAMLGSAGACSFAINALETVLYARGIAFEGTTRFGDDGISSRCGGPVTLEYYNIGKESE